MTNSKELFEELLNKIELPDRDEATAILYYLLEAKANLTRSDILMNKKVDVSAFQFENEISRINAEEPIQYIAGYAWFRNRKFMVNPFVLIPRPETELLVQEVINENGNGNQPTILDVGTGSGCIAISLALEISQSKILALDISAKALEVAKQNADSLNVRVHFIKSDFLSEDIAIQDLDLIVSNPPYVRELEKVGMGTNVLGFEPHLALFVPDDDPLMFYKALAKQGKKLLKSGGKIFVEINPQLANETKLVFVKENYRDVSLIKDMEGKDRIVVSTH